MFGERRRRSHIIARRRLARYRRQRLLSGSWFLSPDGNRHLVELGYFRKQSRQFSGHGRCCRYEFTYKYKGGRKRRVRFLRALEEW